MTVMVSFSFISFSRKFETECVECKMETENHLKADRSIFGRKSRKIRGFSILFVSVVFCER